MSKLISIIIPVFNHAHTIERCLKSITEQTYRPFEVIVVNDGSTDELEPVLRKIENEIEDGTNQIPPHHRTEAGSRSRRDRGVQGGVGSISLKVIDQPNQGAAAARNRGFKEAKGEYVIFWDADTVGKPGMLGRLVEALERNPQASYAYSQFKFGWKKFRCQNFNAEDLKKNNYIDTTSLIRREALNTPSTVLPLSSRGGPALGGNGGGNEKHRVVSLALSPVRGETQRGVSGPFDESLARFQDWDLWLTLLEQNKTGTFVPEVLYTKIVQGRKGMSSWLPIFFYQLFDHSQKVLEFKKARQVILKKHHIL